MRHKKDLKNSSLARKRTSLRRKSATVSFEDSFLHQSSSKPASKEKKIKGNLLYGKNQFLAVKNVDGSFYLCRTKQLVYDSLKKFLIQWLEEDSKNPGHYNLVYFDHVELDCVIEAVKLTRITSSRFQLPAGEENKILRLLKKPGTGKTTKDKGLCDEEEDDDDDDDDEAEEDDEEDVTRSEPPMKKLKRTRRAKAGTHSHLSVVLKTPSRRKSTKSKGSAIPSSPKRKTPAGRKVSPLKDEKSSDKKTAGKGNARSLKPRLDIQVLKQDPFFHSKEHVPFLSASVQSKLLMRAVYLQDVKLLKSYIDDRMHISAVNMKQSVDVELDAIKVALRLGNLPMVQLLVKEYNAPPKPRVAPSRNMLTSINTGTYNKISLGGISHIRKLAASRGSREGNNAFTSHSEMWRDDNARSYLNFCLKEGLSKKTLDQLIVYFDNDYLKNQAYEKICTAVAMGHRKLAAELVSDYMKTGNSYFNVVHLNVLAFDKEPLQTPIREASVKKKPWDNNKITPIHCAAINPNADYLKTLLAILPEYGITDINNRKPVHYAAACVGAGPLEFLLDRGQDPDEPDKKGMTSLMVACQCGRSKNVELILKKAAVLNTGAGSKYGTGGIDRPNIRDYGLAPIHYAVTAGSLDCVKVLISYKANLEKELGPSRNKSTPLMLACSMGHIDICKFLVEAGAKPDKKDKIKKTPLMYASLNGHAHIVSYLLHLGCDPNSADSSGNSALQYAAAYGWYFCLKLLLKAGADPNHANDWKMTPLALAFLKGHTGLADILLDESETSINFRLDAGSTLVMMACSSDLSNESIVAQLEYLVVKKKADCSLVNDSNMTALHCLANNGSENSAESPTAVKMAEILIDSGCDPNARDQSGLTALIYAIQNGNSALASFLIRKGGGVSDSIDSEGKNILHFLAERCMKQDVSSVFKLVVKGLANDSDILRRMMSQYDNNGYMPVLLACREYSRWDGNVPYNYKFESLPKSDEGQDKEVSDDDSDGEDDIRDDQSTTGKKKRLQSNARKLLKGMIAAFGLNAFTVRVLPKKKKEKTVPTVNDVNTISCNESEDDNDDADCENDVADCENDAEEEEEQSGNDDDDGDDDDSGKINRKVVERETVATEMKLDDVPEKEKYFDISEAQYTLLHFLANVRSEEPAKKRKTGQSKASTGQSQTKQDGSNNDVIDIDIDDDDQDELKIVDYEDEDDDAGQQVTGQQVKTNSSNKNQNEKDVNQNGVIECPALAMALEMLASLKSRKVATPGEGESSQAADLMNIYEAENLRGLSPLMEAIVRRRKEASIRLIKCGANLTKRSKAGSSLYKGTPLMLAVKHHLFSVVPELLKAGADPGEVDERTRCTPLHFLIVRKPEMEVLYETVSSLLEHGADPNALDIFDQSPLHKLAKNCRDHRKLLDVAQLLLDKGASLSLKDSKGRTPLHISMAYNPGGVNSSTKFEELLLSKSTAEIEVRDLYGRTPLHYAYATITSFKPNVDPTNLTFLMTNNSKDPKSLVNTKDHRNWTPLHLAASIGAGVSCIHLIQKGANLEAVTNLNNTPLALTIANEKESCAILLLLQNANINCDITIDHGSRGSVSGILDDGDAANTHGNRDVIKCDADFLKDVKDDDRTNNTSSGRKTDLQEEVKKELPKWTFLPLPKAPKEDSIEKVFLIQGVIQLEWQGVVFMMMELIKKFSIRLSTIIEATFVTTKYHLALNLIERTKSKDDLVVMERTSSVGGASFKVSSRNLAHLLALNVKEAKFDENVVAVAELLFKNGVDFWASDSFGCTPLHYACLNMNKPLVTFMLGLNSRAGLVKRDNAGRSALTALFWNNIGRNDDLLNEMTEQLVNAGLGLDFLWRFSIPRHAFSRFGEKQKSPSLSYLDPSFITSSSPAPSICAAAAISPQKPSGADPSSKTSAGAKRVTTAVLSSSPSKSSSADATPYSNSKQSLAFTMLLSPLALAVIEQNVKVVGNLVVLGANVNLGDGWGRSPLMLAVALNNMSLIRRLLHSPERPAVEYPHVFFNPPPCKRDDNPDNEGVQSGSTRDQFGLGRQNLALANGAAATSSGGEPMDCSDDGAKDGGGGVDNDEGIDLTFPPLTMTSDVELNSLDNRGRCVLHYLVPFCDDCTGDEYAPGGIGEGDNGLGELIVPCYDNHTLLLQLVSLGARFDNRDKSGQSVKERAHRNGCKKIMHAITHLEKRANVVSTVAESPVYKRFFVTDAIDWSSCQGVVDPDEDSGRFLAKFEKEMEKFEKVSAFKAVPDEHLSQIGSGQVLVDEELELPYDVLLFKIDVKFSPWGMYNFYKMQIVHQKSKDLYVLFTKWGRIGDTGQYQQTPFPSREEVVKEFKKVFRAKTGNDWLGYEKFEAKQQKYRLISLESRKQPINRKRIEVDLKSKLSSKLHPRVQDLIKELSDVSALKNAMGRIGLDTSAVVFGRLQKKDLDRAKDILGEMSTLAMELSQNKRLTEPDLEALEKTSLKLADLSNKYYHLLPKKGYQEERLPILSSKQEIDKEMLNIDLLFELEIATRFMVAAMEKKTVINPLDYIYKCLECKIVAMEENDLESQYLLKYISNTWPGKVEAIFKIQRKLDEGKFLAGNPPHNRKLLFHGSSSANLISILNRGFLITPPGVNHAGSLFGDGIYMADIFEKSLGYCYNYSSANSHKKYMLVCEADLGKAKVVHSEYLEKYPPPSFDSVLGLGNQAPDPKFDITLPTGCVIPLGQKINLRAFWEENTIYPLVNYNEYIVYTPDRVALRYLVQFKH